MVWAKEPSFTSITTDRLSPFYVCVSCTWRGLGWKWHHTPALHQTSTPEKHRVSQHCIRRRPLKSTERVSIATLPGAKHNKQNNVTWKRRLEVRNSKPFSLFVFLFASACERLFIKMHRIESRCDTEPGNRLFAGTSVHFQPGNLTGWDSEGVNHDHLLNDEMISRHGVQTGLFGWPKST